MEKSKCLTYQTNYQLNINSLFIYQDTLDGCLKEGRRETWSETVGRYFNFFESHLEEMCGYKLDSKTKNELEEAILETRVMPSMRCLMTAGEALKKENIAGYNCSYVAVDRVASFDEILYVLMNGTGVGFSVERQYMQNFQLLQKSFICLIL